MAAFDRLAGFFHRLGERWRRVRVWFHLAVSGVVIVLSLLLFIYPAVVICLFAWDSELRTTGQSRMVPGWFESAAGRYGAWADGYLESEYAASLDDEDVAATEWPMFGSAFFLVTAEELHRQGKIDATQGTVREAVDRAAQIVASPTTATWVREKWGDDYLERENVFYRMLVILGLSSYESITEDDQYHDLMSEQRETLAAELMEAPYHLRDDYPFECYPCDVLWAVAAIQRAGRLDGTSHDELAEKLIAVLDGPLRTPEGLPAFQADADSGTIQQAARGSGNSGILQFAAELDPEVASQWYAAYEAGFWKESGWIAGFTEAPRGADDGVMDVDSGPVLFEYGSVASAFGIGAAKTVGRVDHAAPLTTQVVATSWPTPFGPLVTGVMGKAAADSWCLGEVAMLFSMTRPCRVEPTIPFEGSTPGIVWALVALYAGIGAFLIWYEVRSCRRLLRQHRQKSNSLQADKA